MIFIKSINEVGMSVCREYELYKSFNVDVEKVRASLKMDWCF